MNIIQTLTQKEQLKQRDTVNLIASENYPSLKTLELLGSVWSNKYAEGYPGKRYYAGNIYTDELESFVQRKALQVFAPFGGYGVNVQVLSGSSANAMVYLSCLSAGDTVMSLSLANGGHLSHMHSTSNWMKFFHHIEYNVKEVAEHTFEVDEEDFIQKLEAYKPKLVIIGFSAYPRAYTFGSFIEKAHAAGALVLADIAHINGLVAANLHDSPFSEGVRGADFVSMTTHKTLRGPRAAMLFAKDEYIGMINKTIFPGTSGGPHMNKIAAIGQSLLEILGEDQHPDNRSFPEYAQRILDTCKQLETGLKDSGLTIVSPTQNHLCLVKFPDEIDSLEAQILLESVGIITNRNAIPFDPKTPWRPSGMRFGTAALASRELTVESAYRLGMLIGDIVLGKIDQQKAKGEVQALIQELSWWYRD